MIVNCMEEIVEDVVNLYIESHPDEFPCTCKVCKEDVRCMILNNVNPKYITRKEGVVYGRYALKNVQEMADLYTKIIKAAKTVRDSPRCGREAAKPE